MTPTLDEQLGKAEPVQTPAPVTREAMPMALLRPMPANQVLEIRNQTKAVVGHLLTGRHTYRDKHGKVKLNKEGYYLLARAFNVQFDIIEREEQTKGNDFVVKSRCHAYVRGMPQIQHTADGSCSWKELEADGMKPTEHIVRARADTRSEKRTLEALIAPGDFLPDPEPAGRT